jgi:hypothetical protein
MSNPIPPPPDAGVAAPRSQKATTILILGILAIVCCQVCGPIAWYMGHQELASIRQGMVSSLDEGVVKAGMILGIVGTILLGLALLWIVFFGGLAFLGALMESGNL